jgi:MoaA/NifB/PqqE/SkfB family radical SAM enzyme
MLIPPKMLSVFLTAECNLECDFCYTNASKTSANIPRDNLNTLPLSMIQWKSLLIEAFRMGYRILHIFGGEPLLSPQLPEICQIAREMGFSILIATNGTLLSPEKLKWLKEFEVELSFTINDIEISWERYDPIKKQHLLDLTYANIPISIATCLTKRNYTFYEQFLRDFSQHGPWGFFGIYFSPIGRGKDHLELVVPPHDWIQMVKELPRKYPVRIENAYLEKNEVDCYPDVPFTCPCPTGNMCTISYTGEIYPCILLMSPEWQIGQYAKDGDLKHALTICTKSYLREKSISLYPDIRRTNAQFVGCPAYFRSNGRDFRIDAFPENELFNNRIYIICPLLTL